MAYKWAMLLRARGIAISNMEAFRIYLLSSFAGTFLPTSVGADVVKLARTTLSTGKIENVAASILMERAIGVMGLMALGLIGLSFLIAKDEYQFLTIFYSTGIVFAGLAFVVALSLRNDIFHWLDTKLARWKKYKTTRMILDSHSAYVDLGEHKRVLIWFFLLSMLEHTLLAFVNYCGGLALGLPIQFVYFMAIIPIAGVIEMFPISIGGIGVAEGLYIVLFALAGLSAEEALSLAIYMRAVGLLAVTPGAIVFVQDSMHLRRLRSNRKQS